jgi:hypothetical protein
MENYDIKLLRILNESKLLKESLEFHNELQEFVRYLHYYESNLSKDDGDFSLTIPLYRKFEKEVKDTIKKHILTQPSKEYVLTPQYEKDSIKILKSIKDKYLKQVKDPDYKQNYNIANVG